MRRQLVPMLIGSLIALAGLSTWRVMAQTSACQLAPVFLMLRNLIGKDRMGDCTSAVVRSEAGDFNQPTTHGMLTFRPGDLIVAFSAGSTTRTRARWSCTRRSTPRRTAPPRARRGCSACSRGGTSST